MPLTLLKYLKNPWVLLALVIGLFLLYRKFVGGVPFISVFNPSPLPNGSSVGVDLSESDARAVRELSIRLHNDLVGPMLLSSRRDVDAWRAFMSMPDDLFVAVYNDFGQQYFKEGNGTLTQWIQDELTWWDLNGVASRTDILNRLASLNLN